MLSIFRQITCILLLTSCGLRESENLNDNVLQGSWTLQRISCALTETSGTEVERYDVTEAIGGTLDVTMLINSNQVEYVASGTCTTSSYANYTTRFDGTSQGEVEFYNVLTGGETCTQDINDSGASTIGTQTIPTTMISSNTKDLNWIYDDSSSSLELEYYAVYNGSAESVTCSSDCYCTALFIKD